MQPRIKQLLARLMPSVLLAQALWVCAVSFAWAEVVPNQEDATGGPEFSVEQIDARDVSILDQVNDLNDAMGPGGFASPDDFLTLLSEIHPSITTHNNGTFVWDPTLNLQALTEEQNN